MNPTSPVAGVVLAAGLSTRMGSTKQLLSLASLAPGLGDETLVARAARTACEAGLSPVLVVVGHDAGRVRDAIAHLPVIAVDNPDAARGIHSSLRSGFSALGAHAADAGAAVVLLGDMPLVNPAMVRRLVACWRASRHAAPAAPAPLVISLYGEVVAPPILYDASLFAELAALPDEGCGKRVIKRHRAAAIEVHWPAWALADLDEPGDLSRIAGLLDRLPDREELS